jgi:hypothetical protein
MASSQGLRKNPLLAPEQREQLLDNGRKQQDAQAKGGEVDFFQIVKLFTPDAGATWLLSELDPDDPDIAFGLCDLGLGFPELGYVSLSALEELRGPRGLPVERDRHFTAKKPMSEYARDAHAQGRIVT